MCFVWIWEQTAIISLYNINWLVFITETECVYCAVRTGYFNKISDHDLPVMKYKSILIKAPSHRATYFPLPAARQPPNHSCRSCISHTEDIVNPADSPGSQCRACTGRYTQTAIMQQTSQSEFWHPPFVLWMSHFQIRGSKMIYPDYRSTPPWLQLSTTTLFQIGPRRSPSLSLPIHPFPNQLKFSAVKGVIMTVRRYTIQNLINCHTYCHLLTRTALSLTAWLGLSYVQFKLVYKTSSTCPKEWVCVTEE